MVVILGCACFLRVCARCRTITLSGSAQAFDEQTSFHLHSHETSERNSTQT